MLNLSKNLLQTFQSSQQPSTQAFLHLQRGKCKLTQSTSQNSKEIKEQFLLSNFLFLSSPGHCVLDFNLIILQYIIHSLVPQQRFLQFPGCSCISLAQLLLLWNRVKTEVATQLPCQKSTKFSDKAKLGFPEVRLNIRLEPGSNYCQRSQTKKKKSRQWHSTQPCSISYLYSHCRCSPASGQKNKQYCDRHVLENMAGHLKMKAG